ncbi:LCP family protein [Clostridium bornimense]|uniref:LCP family protein n=1 Tax=Clostridium bornimense TaxID=1216932 RepID=UPI00209D0075|nr:LCP family protein [Clostridium bornimense]
MKKIVLWILGVLLSLTVVAVGGTFFYVKHMIGKVDHVKIKKDDLGINEEIEEKYGDIRNIALYGIDAEEGKAGRSDSIMILTVDTKNNKLKLTSIMRDSYVNIADHGYDKINHAYAFGGPELAMRTLNENFDLNVKEFMAVNFTSMPEIIDKLGGVNIDITDEEIQYIPGITSAGTQKLTGKQALAYARIRYATGGDYKRTERHRTVLTAIFNEMKSKPVSQYPSLASDFLPYVRTNISSNEMLSLMGDIGTLMSGNLEQNRFPTDEQGEGKMINGVYYMTFNIEEVKNSMHQFIFQ